MVYCHFNIEHSWYSANYLLKILPEEAMTKTLRNFFASQKTVLQTIPRPSENITNVKQNFFGAKLNF